MTIKCTKCGRLFETDTIDGIINLCPECSLPGNTPDILEDIFNKD